MYGEFEMNNAMSEDAIDNKYEIDELITYIELACGALRYSEAKGDFESWSAVLKDMTNTVEQLKELVME